MTELAKVTSKTNLRFTDVLPAQIRCPHCNQRMSYVGAKHQDLVQPYEVAFKQHWQHMHSIANPSSVGDPVPVPDGYKCFFCSVQPLSTSKATWRLPFGHFSESDIPNAELRKRILKRDNYTCMDCGLRLPRHMEVRHLDENHSNNDSENLRCVCPFCHMRDHLGPTGFAQAAYVISNPVLPQAQINIAVLVGWYIMDRISDDDDIREKKENEDHERQGALRRAASLMLGDLYAGGIRWSEGVNKAATDPFTFGSILSKLRYEVMETVESAVPGGKPTEKIKEHLHLSHQMTNSYKERNVRFAPLSLLPRKEAFSHQLPDWFAYFDKVISLDKWKAQLEQLLKRLDIDAPTTLYSFINEWNKKLVAETAGVSEPPIAPQSVTAAHAAKFEKHQKPIASSELSKTVLPAQNLENQKKNDLSDRSVSDQLHAANAVAPVVAEKTHTEPSDAFLGSQASPEPVQEVAELQSTDRHESHDEHKDGAIDLFDAVEASVDHSSSADDPGEKSANIDQTVDLFAVGESAPALQNEPVLEDQTIDLFAATAQDGPSQPTDATTVTTAESTPANPWAAILSEGNPSESDSDDEYSPEDLEFDLSPGDQESDDEGSWK